MDKYPATFYAFGSRAKEACAEFSDIDLLVVGKVDLQQLKEAFYESNLSVKVDVKEKNQIGDSFFNLIKEDLVLLKTHHCDHRKQAND